MKSKIKTNSGKIFSARKTSIFFAILFILVLAISYSCKKNEATDPGTFTIEDTISSDTLVRSPLNSDKGYNKVPINISFTEKSGNRFSYSLAATYTNASITVDTDIFYNNGEITFSDDIYNTLTSDGYSNATLTFTLTADNAGLNNPTIVKSYDIKLIKATVITNEDTTANGLNLSNAIYVDKLFTNNNDNNKIEFNFTSANISFTESAVNFTNNESGAKAVNVQVIGDTIRQNIINGANFSKYFANMTVQYDSGLDNAGPLIYNVVFVPYSTNDMTNAGNYKFNFYAKGTDVKFTNAIDNTWFATGS